MRLTHLLKTTALTALLVIAGKVGWGQAILTETFNFATPAYIGGNGNTGSTSNGWTTHSVTTGQTSTIDINDGSLSYPGLVASNGNKVYLFGNNNLTSRDVNAAFTSTATTLYFSALVSIIDNSQITTTGDYFMSFCQTSGSSSGSLGGRLGAKSVNSGANFRFIVQNTSTGTLTWTDNGTDLVFGTTYLVVIKYDRSASPTVATMWVNPTTLGSTEPAGSVSNSSGTGTVTAFGAIGLRNNATTPKAYIDEIRVGTTFADVTPDVTPPSPVYTPASAATGVDINTNITVNYYEHVFKLDGTEIANNDATVIGLKKTGVDVPFTYTIDADKKIITIDPTDPLAYNSTYNVTASVEDAYGNESVTSINFTTRDKYTTATVTSDYTVTGSPTWTISNIPANVLVETFESKVYPVEASTFETYESTVTTPIVNGNPVLSGQVLKVTSEDGLTTQNYTLVVTPALTAATSNNDVEHNFDITYPTDAAWKALITDVKVNGTSLAPADYDITVAGTITLKPTNGNALLTTAGTKTITVVATGYADATVSQVIKAGAINTTNSTISINNPLALSSTSTVTLTAKDQFNNAIENYVFKYDATHTNTGTAESYTINGTATTASVTDVALPATAANGQITFDIVIPALVDGGDGISVQVQLNDGTTNFGSAYAYSAPTVPAINASATLEEATLNGATVNITVLNETFVNDAAIDKANVTLNNAPAGLTVDHVVFNSTTSATIHLAFDGTDFDADVTNFNITIAASEFTLNGALTSSPDLTITALTEVAPAVTTAAAITTNGITTATWEGTITADGGEAITEKGICWGTAADPTTSDNKATDATAGMAITGNITGLTANTTYHVRAYAINSLGTSYGEDRTFTTLKSNAKAITATTIGTIDEPNKKIINVPGPTKVSELKAAITVSANATFEIYTATGGNTVATATNVVTTAYVIRVTAQDASTQEYGIGIEVKTAATLAEILTLPANTRVKYTGTATVTTSRTYRNQKYIQDATAAVLIDDPTTAPGFITDTYSIGDGISNVEGKIVLYYGVVELTPYAATGTKVTSGQPTITPEVRTIASLTEADQSKLVKINNVTFTNPLTEGDQSGNFASGKNYTINDGTSRDTVYQFRTAFSEADYIGTAIPTNAKNIVGFVVLYKKNTVSKLVIQITARNLADFLSTGVEENLNSNLSVYPNPFTNEIRFEGSQDVKRVIVTNITGQVVLNASVVENRIDTQNLPKGMYVITLMNSKGEKANRKMIKE